MSEQPTPVAADVTASAAELQARAAVDYATYQATRTRQAAVGNLTRGQQGGQR